MIKPVWGRLTVDPIDITETDDKLKRLKELGMEIAGDSENERLQAGQIEGKLLAVGGNCFDEWKEPIPQVGDKVVFDKFAGFIKKDGDNVLRIIADTDIMAIIGD